MSTHTRFYIENQGVVRETVTRESIQISTDILAQYAGEKTNKIGMVMAAEAIHPLLQGYVNLAVRGAVLGVTVCLKTLPLRTKFKVHSGVLVPDFASDDTPMVMEWTPPPDMYIAMLIISANGSWVPTAQYLIAADSSGRTYRLPTSNVYDDCKMCTGKYASSGSTVADMVARSVEQLESSDWQRDLLQSADAPLTTKLFRYKPREKEGFDQMPYEAEHWTKLCRKVGNDTITMYLNL